MDVTPQELRDSEIKPAFRGYDQDVVNELLDRAAATIETQNEKIRLLTDRLANAQNDTGGRRETEDLLHKTLLLAQRAADEAIAEAQEKSREIVRESEGTARGMIAEAELEVRRISEVERRRAEDEVMDLIARRDALLADVRALEAWEGEYRQRVVQQIEQDLDLVRGRVPAAPAPTPALKNVELPEAVLRRTEEPTQSLTLEPPAPIDTTAPASADIDEPEAMAASMPAPAMVLDDPEDETPSTPGPFIGSAKSDVAERPSYLDEVLAPPTRTDERTTDIDLSSERDLTSAADLDDDEFFATLRDAVRDDASLGSGDDMLDDDREPTFREMFRRRR
jgi:cell division initiation protein